ncbi:MAG: hypothetical protein GTO13_03705 [Proteobacteria bacterium]|nr:hypothetical protein [Pseudomonadota bacterium]
MEFPGKQSRAIFWITTFVLSLVLIWFGEAAMGFTKKDLRRINDEGPVEISVVYLNPLQKKAGAQLSFEVRMNTHSVGLDAYEMEKICFLQIDGGPEQKPLGWFNQGGGGHHVSGILKFAGSIPSDAKSLQVIIREVGRIPERVFEWKLPLE